MCVSHGNVNSKFERSDSGVVTYPGADGVGDNLDVKLRHFF